MNKLKKPLSKLRSLGIGKSFKSISYGFIEVAITRISYTKGNNCKFWVLSGIGSFGTIIFNGYFHEEIIVSICLVI